VSSGISGPEQSPVAASSAERLSLLRVGVGRRFHSLCAGADITIGTNPQHATGRLGPTSETSLLLNASIFFFPYASPLGQSTQKFINFNSVYDPALQSTHQYTARGLDSCDSETSTLDIRTHITAFYLCLTLHQQCS